MKHYYDKILLALAFVVLAIGVGYFFYTGGLPAHAADPLVGTPLSGNNFEPIAPPEFNEVQASWDTPQDQTPDDQTGWTYGIFTPPKIWWDGDHWTSEQPGPGGQKAPFGVHLIGLRQQPYRLQIAATFPGIDADHPATVVFTDGDNGGRTFRDKVGDTDSAHDVKVVDYSDTKVPNVNAGFNHVYTVTVTDLRTNKNYTLTQGQLLVFPDQRYLLLETDDPYPSQEWRVQKVGDRLDATPDTYFVALSIDFDSPAVTVEKHYPPKNAGPRSHELKETRVLTPEDTSTDSSSATPPAAPAKKAAKSPF
jgi:hypothetical protein